MSAFSKMIKFIYPDAVPGVDFTERSTEDGKVELAYWNERKLGSKPELMQLHAAYMRDVMRRKEYLPKTDTTDPAPWLNDSPPADTSAKTEAPAEKVLRASLAGLPVVNIDPVSGNIRQKEAGELW